MGRSERQGSVNPDRHLACVERIYADHIGPHIGDACPQLPLAMFIEYYHEACRTQIAASKQSQREHTFDDRFAMALDLAGVKSIADRAIYRRMSDALGREVVQCARLLDHAAEVVEQLATDYRLGIVSWRGWIRGRLWRGMQGLRQGLG